jgi:putative Mg2+ transporter-C (MgtC) family protein
MIDWPDAVIRLTAAAVIGGAIGADRELRGKPTGVRTMGIVALGSALVVLVSQHPGGIDAAAGSRVIQGVITGIGFLGAGVILRNPAGKKVHGLTTAAAIWLTACIGVACGLGAWPLVGTSAILTVIILVFGARLERALDLRDPHHKRSQEREGEHGQEPEKRKPDPVA